MDIGTTAPVSGTSSTTPPAAAIVQTATRAAHRPPSLVERMPGAYAHSMLAMPPNSSVDFLAPSGTQPQLQPAAELLNLPNDLLRHLTAFLRTANTIPAIRHVARLRAACKDLHLRITEPIPDGMMGLIEFNRLEPLKQMLVELQQSGKDVAGEVNNPGPVMKIRDPELKACCLTPLMAAAYLGHAELVTVLVRTGAVVNKTISGLTALMLAAQQGHTEIALALIQAGAKARPAGPVDWTALLYAAANGRTVTVKALLDAGAEVNLLRQDHWTALMSAARNGHTATVHALLQAGATVDQARFNGSTALMEAAANGHTTVVRALLDAGANAWIRNTLGHSALSLAMQRNHQEIIKRLRAYGDAD
jgi:hypothetical protein